jgi:hypothetical protein
MGMGNPGLLAGIAQYAIIGFAVVAAVDQLGIAETVVNTLFTLTIGALALAFGLAFGLGGQQVAAQMTQSWYTRGKEATQKVAEYAERKQAEAESDAPAPAKPPASTGAPPTRTDPATGS